MPCWAHFDNQTRVSYPPVTPSHYLHVYLTDLVHFRRLAVADTNRHHHRKWTAGRRGGQGSEQDQLPINVIVVTWVWDCSAMPFCRISLAILGSVIQGSSKVYPWVIQGLSYSLSSPKIAICLVLK